LSQKSSLCTFVPDKKAAMPCILSSRPR
jgi:hypothetical protein